MSRPRPRLSKPLPPPEPVVAPPAPRKRLATPSAARKPTVKYDAPVNPTQPAIAIPGLDLTTSDYVDLSEYRPAGAMYPFVCVMRGEKVDALITAGKYKTIRIGSVRRYKDTIVTAMLYSKAKQMPVFVATRGDFSDVYLFKPTKGSSRQ